MDTGHFIMRAFGESTAFSQYSNPNHGTVLRWNRYPDEPKSYECCVLNSEAPSDQVWLGSNDRWYRFYGGSEFRRMAAWVLWRWIWHDWCGLKTRLWLIGLYITCRNYDK
jgi:hypothetical protein